MASMGSVTKILNHIGQGPRDEAAVRELWGRYFGELTRYALWRLEAAHADRALADEEDAAATAFAEVLRGIEQGRLSFENRDRFEKMLRWNVRNKARNQRDRQPADRAVGGREEDALPEGAGEAMPPDLRLLAEEGCRQLLDALGEGPLRRIALWKLLGYTNEEIARKLGCSKATLGRKIERIGSRWAALAPGLTPRPGPRNPSGAAMDVESGGTTTILRELDGRP